LRDTLPLRGAWQRFSVLGFVILAVALLALGRSEPRALERARLAIVDFTAPVLFVIGQPMMAAQQVVERGRQMARVYDENERLREENARLQQWQLVARGLDAENRDLRRLLQLPGDPPLSFVTARVVANAGGSFVRSIVVLAGQRDNVAKGNAAVTAEGLVGRVTEAGERAARVLLITDMNSNVPVRIERTRESGIVAGDNSDRLKLLFVAGDSWPQIGDRIVTSGHGGVFPPGLPVGVVVAVVDGIPRIQPFADSNSVEYVRLVDYGVGGMLPQAAPTPAPARGGRGQR
jgi:rod shape-determining protein MreC